ncbi:MAG: OmpH family outer membrane protein [Planctomycetes bacterium]|nr:OmpH family outer membrane protein [Planctomycetota bacterium]MCA8945215.1 OmpH family outer membrane protein [Planctomycetota bacterium]
MQDLKTKVWTRISLIALAAVLMAGVFAGGVLIRADVEAQDSDKPATTEVDEATQKAIDAAVQKALNTPPIPRRTAYVDFLSLLKSDRLLLGKQQEMAESMQREMDDIDKRFGKLIQEQARIRELNKPDSIAYRQAMNKQLELERQRYQEKLLFEQLTQAELRDFAIDRFKKLRNLAADIAKGKGYNEVLNIVRNIDEVTGGQNDFQALQQQLLVSPVLYYESAHDITDDVTKKADELWGETISFVVWDEETKAGGVEFYVVDPAKPEEPGKLVSRNAAGEIEIRLGQKGDFKISVLDKGEPAASPRDRVNWSKRGVNVGELASGAGSYTSPEKFPPNGDTFIVTVRSMVDPTVSETVTIRLLDKDGKPMPAKED